MVWVHVLKLAITDNHKPAMGGIGMDAREEDGQQPYMVQKDAVGELLGHSCHGGFLGYPPFLQELHGCLVHDNRPVARLLAGLGCVRKDIQQFLAHAA